MNIGEKIAITVIFAIWALFELIYSSIKVGESFKENKSIKAFVELVLMCLTPSVIGGTAMFFCWEVL